MARVALTLAVMFVGGAGICTWISTGSETMGAAVVLGLSTIVIALDGVANAIKD
ncbi:MAG: hypothetical protein U1C66_01160 [Patescibacteria group bacterium]|nr:hypothetical protein [Patescibacteria group bacterium]